MWGYLPQSDISEDYPQKRASLLEKSKLSKSSKASQSKNSKARQSKNSKASQLCQQDNSPSSHNGSRQLHCEDDFTVHLPHLQCYVDMENLEHKRDLNVKKRNCLITVATCSVIFVILITVFLLGKDEP